MLLAKLGSKESLKHDLDLEFQGIVIKKIQRRGTRFILEHYGRTFEEEGNLNVNPEIGDTYKNSAGTF